MNKEYNKDIWFFVDEYFKRSPMYKDFFVETWVKFFRADNWKLIPREVRIGIIECVLDYYSTTYTFTYNVFYVGTLIDKSKEEQDLFQEEVDRARLALKLMPRELCDTFLGE